MPIYEFECKSHSKFEKLRPMEGSMIDGTCPECGQLAKRVMSLTHWKMGWNFLKNKSEKSPPAPTDAGYHAEWDQAYAP